MLHAAIPSPDQKKVNASENLRETNEFLGLKPYIYALSGLMGLGVSSLYNNQRNTRLDESWYYRFYGIVMGLLFSSELYEALATLLTPSETFILSQEEYEKNVK